MNPVNALKECRIVNPIESNLIVNRIILNRSEFAKIALEANRFVVYPKIHSSSLQSLDRPKTLPASQCAYYPSYRGGKSTKIWEGGKNGIDQRCQTQYLEGHSPTQCRYNPN